jgi:prohibitin 2
MRKIFTCLLMAWVLQGCGCTVVDPGNRGVYVNLGEVNDKPIPEGFTWISPIASVKQVSVKQQTKDMDADCFSSDLQDVKIKISVLYRIPEQHVVGLFQKYSGDPFDSLVAPRVAEALKEVTATKTAEAIVKNREEIKQTALKHAKEKIGDLIFIEDIVIADVALSKELTKAIESKMVQQQEAAKSEYTKQKAKIEAETAAIKAQGEADAISIRGQAIKENPRLIELTIAEKWNGVSPLVVGAGGTNILLPLDTKPK